jgi:S1-C subfamily serine protease
MPRTGLGKIVGVGVSFASVGIYLTLATPATLPRLPIQPPSDAARAKPFAFQAAAQQACLAQFPSAKRLQAIAQIAQQISVAVFVRDSGGSGVTIAETHGQYWVLTNEHVLRHGQPYRVQMYDGRIYPATPIARINFAHDDLALLQFTAPTHRYPLATLAPAQPLTHQMPLLASGFPQTTVPDVVSPASPNQASAWSGGVPSRSWPTLVRNARSPGTSLHFTCGRLSRILNQPLEGGYQIGYTNPIVKGMSGGPVLNQAGQVVAINGMHAYPLWGNPYVYGDGSLPAPQDIQGMARLSWAIPIYKVTQNLYQVRPINSRILEHKSPPHPLTTPFNPP